MPQSYVENLEHHYTGDRRNEIDGADQKNLPSLAAKKLTAKQQKKLKKKVMPAPVIGANGYAPGSAEFLAQILRTPKGKREATVLDEYIYNQGIADVPFGKTAEHLHMSVAAVRTRYFELLEERNGGTPEQMRMHLLAQLKTIINSMQEAATNGSVDHVKMWILAIERTSKLLDLEQQKAGVTFNIITSAQTELLMKAVMFIVESLKENPTIAKSVDPMVIDVVTAKALTQAGEFLYEATDRQIDAEGQPVVA